MHGVLDGEANVFSIHGISYPCHVENGENKLV